MSDGLITAAELLDFLGADEDAESEITEELQSALEQLERATGIDWGKRKDVHTANQAIKDMVYLSFYAVRDGSQNTEFVKWHLTSIIKQLQYATEENNDTETQVEPTGTGPPG